MKMLDFKIFVVVCTLNSLQFALSEVEEKEVNGNVWHREEDCKDTPKVRLSDGYERFLVVYEEAIKASDLYGKSSEDDKLMLAGIAKMRKMLGTRENELTTQQQELADWVKEFEPLSKESLRKVLGAMIDGSLYFAYNPEDKYKPANAKA